MVRYPFTAATSARPIPVFPLVGSMMVVRPGWIHPDFSAASIMRRAMRSLTLPPAEKNSHFARRLHCKPSSAAILDSEIKGV